jgi:beta-N-acetylhexosaminidase
MMVGFAGQAIDDSVVELVKRRRVGGVCLFGRNIASAGQIARLNDELRVLFSDAVPPFIAVDQEGGNVVRIDDGNLVLPGNMLLGATRDGELAYQAGLRQGEDLFRLGFNMNLAPVLDVNSNPRNPVIGVRAFASDATLVAQLGARFVEGQQAAHIATVAKHFPGHGGVDVDSHRGLPVVRASSEQIREDLKPFAVAAAAGLDGMMTAHIATPTLTGDDLPATLSESALGGVLRGELKFDGLVLTDELEMDAIDRRFGVGHAAVMAISAGADMVLVPWHTEKKAEVYDSLLSAARSGVLPRERLDQAVRRILVVKERRGVFEPLPPREERLGALGAGRDLAERIAHAGVTLLRQSKGFPIDRFQRLAVVTPEASLAEALSSRVKRTETLLVPAYPDAGARDGLKLKTRALAMRADVVVVGVVNSRQLELVTIAALTGRPVMVVVMGAPYLVSQMHETGPTVVVVYSYRPAATAAAAGALLGEHGTPGRLPVALPGAPLGFGLDPLGSRSAERPRLPAGTISPASRMGP